MKRLRKFWLIFGALLITAFAVACETADAAPVPPTAAPAPTSTPLPEPTATPIPPIATPVPPTSTPNPTAVPPTLAPESTPVPPTPTPKLPTPTPALPTPVPDSVPEKPSLEVISAIIAALEEKLEDDLVLGVGLELTNEPACEDREGVCELRIEYSPATNPQRNMVRAGFDKLAFDLTGRLPFDAFYGDWPKAPYVFSMSLADATLGGNEFGGRIVLSDGQLIVRLDIFDTSGNTLELTSRELLSSKEIPTALQSDSEPLESNQVIALWTDYLTGTEVLGPHEDRLSILLCADSPLTDTASDSASVKGIVEYSSTARMDYNDLEFGHHTLGISGLWAETLIWTGTRL